VDPLSQAKSQSGQVQDRESGRFSLEFYSDREGQLSLDLGNGPGSVTERLRINLLKARNEPRGWVK
jgi:hypothetical protein